MIYLPIAIGILNAYGALQIKDLSRFLLVGELGLDGGLRPVPGILPIAVLAREREIANVILPAVNAPEAAVVKGVAAETAAAVATVVAVTEAPVRTQAAMGMGVVTGLAGPVRRIPLQVQILALPMPQPTLGSMPLRTLSPTSPLTIPR